MNSTLFYAPDFIQNCLLVSAAFLMGYVLYWLFQYKYELSIDQRLQRVEEELFRLSKNTQSSIKNQKTWNDEFSQTLLSYERLLSNVKAHCDKNIVALEKDWEGRSDQQTEALRQMSAGLAEFDEKFCELKTDLNTSVRKLTIRVDGVSEYQLDVDNIKDVYQKTIEQLREKLTEYDERLAELRSSYKLFQNQWKSLDSYTDWWNKIPVFEEQIENLETGKANQSSLNAIEGDFDAKYSRLSEELSRIDFHNKEQDEKLGLASNASDDLTQVEGIGPKMNQALQNAGIRTFRQLAETDEESLKSAIEQANLRFAPSLPTWSRQSKLAAEGKWKQLVKLQDKLIAGRDD